MSREPPRKFNCWKCGLLLEDLAIPVPRYEACPACRAELHSCRMCRHFDPKMLGQCRHDRADRVVKKHEANYCTFFRPRPGAHRVQRVSPAESSEAELRSLFGLSGSETTTGPTLDSLFDTGGDRED